MTTSWIVTPAPTVVVVRLAGGGNTTVTHNVSVLEEPSESCARTVKVNAPAVVAVPEMAPVAGFSDKPGGSVPSVTLQVYGGEPPVATSDSEYATPACGVRPATDGMEM